MSAEIHRLFPGGLRHAESERGKPRHSPPLRFVPTKGLPKEDTEDSPLKTITVELAQKTSQKVTLYDFGGVETFLLMQKNHEYFLAQQDARKKYDSYDELDDDAIKKIDAVPEDTSDKKELATIEKLEDLRLSLSDKMDKLVAKAFNLYQQMLSPTLRAEWDDIVQEHCFTVGWTDDQGVVSTENRGQDWDTLQECKRLHLLTVCKKDAAERHSMYMNVTVKKPSRMTIETYYKRLKELDALAPMLPCLKDQPDCPTEIERANVSLTPVAMCNLIMRSISPAMEDEYICMTELMPTNPKKFVELLTKIERKLKDVQPKKKTEDRLTGKGQPDEQSRSHKKRALKASKKVEGAIPRKSLPPKKAVEKLCKLCEEYGGASHTHHTSQCKKWLPGGKASKEWGRGKTTASNINVHEDVGMNQLMAQQVEFQKTMMKQMSKFFEKKKKTKKRKSAKYYSDSESSDSD